MTRTKTKAETAVATTASAALELPPEVAELDQLVSAFNLAGLPFEGGSVSQTLQVARAMRTLREAITDEMMQDVMALRGTAIGFRTDADNKPQNQQYNVEVVKDCAIEAMMRGFRLVGNEMNIIGGRCYGTKEGFKGLLDRWEGFGNLKVTPGIPKLSGEKGAIIEMHATWIMGGVPGEIQLQVPVRVNAGMGTDAILGKAKRKLYAAIHERISGRQVPEGDLSDPDAVIDITGTARAANGAKPAATRAPGELNDKELERELARTQAAVDDPAKAAFVEENTKRFEALLDERQRRDHAEQATA